MILTLPLQQCSGCNVQSPMDHRKPLLWWKIPSLWISSNAPNCGSQEKDLNVCTGCQTVAYCSRLLSNGTFYEEPQDRSEYQNLVHWLLQSFVQGTSFDGRKHPFDGFSEIDKLVLRYKTWSILKKAAKVHLFLSWIINQYSIIEA